VSVGQPRRSFASFLCGITFAAGRKTRCILFATSFGNRRPPECFGWTLARCVLCRPRAG